MRRNLSKRRSLETSNAVYSMRSLESQTCALKHELDEFNTCNALTEGVSDRVAQSVHGFDIPDVFSKAFDDVKTAHVQEINSLELDIENMQQANNAMRIPFDDRIRDQRDCGKE